MEEGSVVEAAKVTRWAPPWLPPALDCSQPCLQTSCQTRSQKNRNRGSRRHGKLCYHMASSPLTRKVFRAAYQKGRSCPLYSHTLKVGSGHSKSPTRTQAHKGHLRTHVATEGWAAHSEAAAGLSSWPRAARCHTLPQNEPRDALLPGLTSSPGKPGTSFSNLLPRTEGKNQKLPLLLLMQAPKKELVKAEKGTELHEKKKKKCGSKMG